MIINKMVKLLDTSILCLGFWMFLKLKDINPKMIAKYPEIINKIVSHLKGSTLFKGSSKNTKHHKKTPKNKLPKNIQ